jgi:hypothetical protein
LEEQGEISGLKAYSSLTIGKRLETQPRAAMALASAQWLYAGKIFR